MNCVEFENRLHASIERHETSCHDELREHANRCKRCDALWQESLFLDQMIAVWKSDLVEPDLVDFVIGEVQDDRQLRGQRAEGKSVSIRPAGRRMQVTNDVAIQRRYRSGVAVLVIVVAAMLLVMLDLGLFRPATDRSRQRPFVQFTNGLYAENKSYEEFQLFLKETRSSYTALTQEAVQAVPDLTGWLTVLRPTQQAIEMKDEPDRPWAEDVQQSLEPIGRDLGKAMDFLYNTLPVNTPATS